MTGLNKKAELDVFSVIFTILAISGLVMVLVGLNGKYSALDRQLGGIGDEAARLYAAYGAGDYALLYLDQSARMSLRQAVYDFGCNGFLSGGGCDLSSNPKQWSGGSAERVAGRNVCEARLSVDVPKDVSALGSYFSGYLESYISAYNTEDVAVEIPKNNYGSFSFSKLSDGIEVLGIAREPVLVETVNLKYEVVPSFRESVGIDVVGDFSRITSEAEGLIGLDEGTMESSLGSLSGNGLRWELEDYVESCASCDAGDCEASVSEERCDDEGNCETVSVSKPGSWKHSYCSITASISVNILDSSFGGNMYFVDNDGKKFYAYRFALSWVEMGDVSCVAK